MQKNRNALVVAVALGFAPVAMANPNLGDARDDVPFVTGVERGSWATGVVLAPDAHDESGVSAREFEAGDGVTSAVSFAEHVPHPYDDAGVSALGTARQVGASTAAESSTARTKDDARDVQCACMM